MTRQKNRRNSENIFSCGGGGGPFKKKKQLKGKKKHEILKYENKFKKKKCV